MLKRMWKHELCLKCLTIMAPAILAQALLLGSLNPTLVMAAKPPDEVPDEFKEDVAKLHKPLAAILVGKEIPWAAQAALGASEDLADRWDTPAAARENGSGTWYSGMGRTGSVQTLAFTAMRLLQAVRVAEPRASPGGPGGPVEGAPGGPV